MTKRQRLHNLETRIGQLEAHIFPIKCPIPTLFGVGLKRLPEKFLDAAIAKRLAWLRENNEKERMGRKRY
jgi:hypothetical protein